MSSNVIQLRVPFHRAGALPEQQNAIVPILRQYFTRSQIGQLDEIIYPHYEGGLITRWHYGKGQRNSYLSVHNDDKYDCNQVFCLIKEIRPNEFTNYKLNVPGLKIIEETVNFEKVVCTLRPALAELVLPVVMLSGARPNLSLV